MTEETVVVDRDYLRWSLNAMVEVEYFFIVYVWGIFHFLVDSILWGLYYHPWRTFYILLGLATLIIYLISKFMCDLVWYFFMRNRCTRMFAKELHKFQQQQMQQLLVNQEQTATPSGSAGRRPPRGKNKN